jgi:hypothetical protein
MGDAIRPPAARAGVTFEVERLERDGDELIVSGHWSGLRGVRFVRPTLVVGDRHVLATLEHKPWTPRADRAWTAAFPWTGRAPDASKLKLAVAPSVTVPLGPPPDDAEPTLTLVAERGAGDDLAPAPAAKADAAKATKRRPSAATDRKRLRLVEEELETVAQERDALRLKLEEAQVLLAAADAARVEVEESLRRERRAAGAAADGRNEVTRARTAAERDRDLAQAQRDEAVQDREAAVRTRTRMELAYEEAVQGQAVAAAEVQRAQAERDEANAQRDEVLLAYRALQRHVQTERAEIDRAQSDAADTDAHEPLGVRTMPAARTVMAELQRRPPAAKFVVSKYDVWVIRVLGSVAAASFILLLVSLARVFV